MRGWLSAKYKICELQALAMGKKYKKKNTQTAESSVIVRVAFANTRWNIASSKKLSVGGNEGLASLGVLSQGTSLVVFWGLESWSKQE